MRLDGVTTDLQVMSDLIERAQMESSGDEIDACFLQRSHGSKDAHSTPPASNGRTPISSKLEQQNSSKQQLFVSSNSRSKLATVTAARFAASQALKALPMHELIYR